MEGGPGGCAVLSASRFATARTRCRRHCLWSCLRPEKKQTKLEREREHVQEGRAREREGEASKRVHEEKGERGRAEGGGVVLPHLAL
eukprot:3502894-Rhodomonas_salina.1